MPNCSICGNFFRSWGDLYDHRYYKHGDDSSQLQFFDDGDESLQCGSETLVKKFFTNGECDTEEQWAAHLPENWVNGDDEEHSGMFCQAVMARRMLQTCQDEPVMEDSDDFVVQKAKLQRMFDKNVSKLYSCKMLETDPRTHDACMSDGMTLQARVDCVAKCFTSDEAEVIGY